MNSSYFFYLYLHLINQKTINFSKACTFVSPGTLALPISKVFDNKQKKAEIRVKSKQKLKTQSAYALLAFSGLHKASEFVGITGCLISHVKLQQSLLRYPNANPLSELSTLLPFPHSAHGQSKVIKAKGQEVNIKNNTNDDDVAYKVDALTNLKKYVDLTIAPVNTHSFSDEIKSPAITWSFNKRILNQSFKSNLQMNLKSLNLSSKYSLHLSNNNDSESRRMIFDYVEKVGLKKADAGRLGHNLSFTTSTPLISLFSGSKAQDNVKPANQIMGLYSHFADKQSNGQSKKTNKKASLYSSMIRTPDHISVGIKAFNTPPSNTNFSIAKFYTASWLLDFLCGELSLRNANIKRVLNQAFIFPIKSDSIPLNVVPDLIKGLKITFSGRMGGKKGMAKTLTKTLGRVPLSTLREKVDFAKGTVKTKVGSLGVKVWICYH